MRKVLLAVLVLALAAGVPASAQRPAGVPGPPPGVGNAPPAPLVGSYAVTGTSVCVQTPNGFNPDVVDHLEFQPIFGPGTTRWTESWDVIGVFIFNGDGTGSVQVRGVTLQNTDIPAIIGGGGSFDAQASFNYAVAPDGTIAVDVNGITGTNLSGFGVRTGQTFVVDNVHFEGYVGAKNLTIALATVVPRVETITFAGGSGPFSGAPYPIMYRVCHRARTLFLRQ